MQSQGETGPDGVLDGKDRRKERKMPEAAAGREVNTGLWTGQRGPCFSLSFFLCSLGPIAVVPKVPREPHESHL